MAEVVISSIKITAAAVAPEKVTVGAEIYVSAVVVEETTRYTYPDAPVLGTTLMSGTNALQIKRALRKD